MVAITMADEKYVQLQLIQFFLDKYDNNNLQWSQLLRWTKYICNYNYTVQWTKYSKDKYDNNNLQWSQLQQWTKH